MESKISLTPKKSDDGITVRKARKAKAPKTVDLLKQQEKSAKSEKETKVADAKDSKVETKTEAKAEVKAETKTETKSEATNETITETKEQPKARIPKAPKIVKKSADSEEERLKRLEELARANMQREKEAKEAHVAAKKQKNKGRTANKQQPKETDEDTRPVRNAKKPRNNANNNEETTKSGKKAAGKGGKGSRTSGHIYSKDTNDYSKYSSSYAKDAEFEEDRRRSKGNRRNNKKSKLKQSFSKPVAPIKRDVVIGETITVAELANRMAVKAAEIVKYYMQLGEMVTINNVLSQEDAQFVAEEFGHNVILRNDNDLELAILNESAEQQAEAKLEVRAPVVTIMGHVDHGKTSLLDYIRKTKVAAGEAGGITQHIGAYSVTLESGRHITFLDTPGHAAFTSMRARGAKATDIVVLVVAADDGVMPQTKEAIEHARAAEVPIIVAVNKIDKPEANPQKVRNELLQYGVVDEALGGDEIFVDVSAKQGINIDELLETIALQAEVLEFKATRNAPASGVVIESFLDKGRGPVATVLVQNGTLHKGDIVLCGLEYGKVRAMRNELGKNLEEAGPSVPVEILGLSGVPSAGDEVTVVADERKAREVSNYRQGKFKELKIARQQKAKLENLFANVESKEVSELKIVLKADVQGSVEALSAALVDLSTDEVKVNIVSSGVGGITETDASLALASDAIIIGFNVRADASARNLIERENIDLRYYSIIYEVIDEVKTAMSGMLAPEYKTTIKGLAEVRDVFRSPKFGDIAGCMVTEGIIERSNPIRVLRDNVVIYEGELESLRRFKDDVQSVRNGLECGIGVKNYNNIQVGDIIEVYEKVRIERKI